MVASPHEGCKRASINRLPWESCWSVGEDSDCFAFTLLLCFEPLTPPCGSHSLRTVPSSQTADGLPRPDRKRRPHGNGPKLSGAEAQERGEAVEGRARTGYEVRLGSDPRT